jgi:hypothetical protein
MLGDEPVIQHGQRRYRMALAAPLFGEKGSLVEESMEDQREGRARGGDSPQRT